MGSVAFAGLAALHEFDFVAFGGIDEGEAAAVRLEVGAVGVLDAVLGEVLAEGLEAFDFEREVGEVGLNFDGAAIGEVAEFDEFFAIGGFEEDEF